ncbi:MAG: glycine cleavage system protein H, partial [Candidatus Nanoarchaeia archaeon]
VNDSLFDEPGKINQEPYNNWIMKVKLDDPKEVEDLMDAKQAEDFYSK